MAVIIEGLPIIGSVVNVLTDSSKPVVSYTYLSGPSNKDLSEIFTNNSSKYQIRSTDSYIKVVVKFYDDSTEESVVYKVIPNSAEIEVETKIPYVGKGLSLYNTLPQDSNKSNIVSDVDRINQSIYIILSTTTLEVPMLDTLGSNIQYYLFRETINSTIEQLKDSIQSAIVSQENRVNLIDVSLDYDNDHTILCTISYNIINSNITSSYSYNISLSDSAYG